MTLTRQLLLINITICAAFLVVIMVVFYSFLDVEKVLTTTFASETRRIIANSNISRELTRVLSDMNLIISTFYQKSDVLKTDGKRLSKGTQALLAQTRNPELRNFLEAFIQQLNEILSQCEQVNAVRSELFQIEEKFDYQLISLDDMITERIVETIINNGDITDLDQLSAMIGGWRETFSRIKLQFMQLGLEHFKDPLPKNAHPLFVSADDLLLRLQTLTASAPEIAKHNRLLVELLVDYKDGLLKFHRTAGILRLFLEKNEISKERLLAMMAKIDRQVAQKTADATHALTARVDQALKINLLIFLGILPIVMLGGMAAYSIKRPVQVVVEYLERLSKGDIPELITAEYKGEFGLVRDYLNTLIRATHNVTQIAENIASGNMDIIVRERSPNDRLMRALERMIQKLNEIMHATRAMIQAVAVGELDVRGDAEAFEGGWRELVRGVNELVQGLNDTISKSAALSQEMALARDIQTGLLPDPECIHHPDLEIAANMLTADQVGGDYYDITLDGQGNLWIAIGDVSGHGVKAGLIMMMAQTVHATIAEKMNCTARDVVVLINAILYRNVHERLKENEFMTFNALKYLGQGQFEHAGAHLRIIVLRRNTGECELIRTKGVYLNLKKDISLAVQNSYFELGGGDVMVLYTDGLTEACNRNGDLLDIGRFLNIIQKHARRRPQTMQAKIMADVLGWCGNERADDMTLVIVKRKGVSDG